jgi:uncharacterized membrane protein
LGGVAGLPWNVTCEPEAICAPFTPQRSNPERATVEKDRLVSFSDGVIAVIITIMVLELKAPPEATLAGLKATAPTFLSYVLSFLYVAIYWNNHHHFFTLVRHVSGTVMWANLHLLFWLSLIPFATSWLGEHPSEATPTAVYGLSLLMPAVAWFVLQATLIRDRDGDASMLARALGGDVKGKVSPLLYLGSIFLAFINTLISDAIFIFVALLWLIPDRRIEKAVEGKRLEQ